LISYICGSTPLNAAVSALISASALSLFILLLIVSSAQGIKQELVGTSELFSLLDNHSVTLLVMTIHAAIAGSSTSILAHMQDFLTDPTQTPLFIYIAILRKPFLAVAFAVLVFSILSSGLVSLRSVDLAGAAGPYLAWVVGFLCGFSERFAQDFVISASSRFTGSSPPDDRPSQPSPNRS
jgi:ABC-type amino acid transport system permease subunit